jgi:hypothetical protein
MAKALKAMAVVVLGGVVSGCAAISAVTYKVTGDPKVPAEYKPVNQPTLVLVENYQNPDQYRSAATELERDIGLELKNNKVTQVIDEEKLENLRSGDEAAYRKMRVAEVGKAVGAKQVIYVNLVKFNALTPIGSGEMSGLCEGLVKVIDVETGRTLWPTDTSAGRDVKYETKHEEAVDFSSQSAVQEQMASAMGDKIARLFYASNEPENDVAPKN